MCNVEGSSGQSPASSTQTSSYVFAATDDLLDCLLCSLRYFAEGERVSFFTRKAYPNIHTFVAHSWAEARQSADALLKGFIADRVAHQDDERCIEGS